jgi:hypothetical protein
MDRQTDMTKLIVAFRNVANALKNSAFCASIIFMCAFCSLPVNIRFYFVQNTNTGDSNINMQYSVRYEPIICV